MELLRRATANATNTTIPNDGVFGPQYGDSFDFTMVFDNIIFTILPASLMIGACPIYVAWYYDRVFVTSKKNLLWVKLVRILSLNSQPFQILMIISALDVLFVRVRACPFCCLVFSPKCQQHYPPWRNEDDIYCPLKFLHGDASNMSLLRSSLRPPVNHFSVSLSRRFYLYRGSSSTKLLWARWYGRHCRSYHRMHTH